MQQDGVSPHMQVMAHIFVLHQHVKALVGRLVEKGLLDQDDTVLIRESVVKATTDLYADLDAPGWNLAFDEALDVVMDFEDDSAAEFDDADRPTNGSQSVD